MPYRPRFGSRQKPALMPATMTIPNPMPIPESSVRLKFQALLVTWRISFGSCPWQFVCNVRKLPSSLFKSIVGHLGTTWKLPFHPYSSGRPCPMASVSSRYSKFIEAPLLRLDPQILECRSVEGEHPCFGSESHPRPIHQAVLYFAIQCLQYIEILWKPKSMKICWDSLTNPHLHQIISKICTQISTKKRQIWYLGHTFFDFF